MKMESSQKELIVCFQNEYYDLSKFALKHPGGVNTLKGLENSDMTSRFQKGPPHSSAAMYLMKEYKLKEVLSSNKDTTVHTNGYRKIATNGHINNSKEIHENNSWENEDFGNYKNDDIQNLTDDSMEHIVDWSKAMLPQIPKITDHYSKWVNKPVDRPLRLFEPWYLEICTKTPWWIIPIFWFPVIIYLVYVEAFSSTAAADVKAFTTLRYFLTGFILWTFVEYSLHRWVFHVQTETKNPWLCTFHFMIHGLHHKVPFDPYRLVFPPVPAVIICSILYIFFIYPLSAYPKITIAGGILGYVCYDLMHYYLHYGSPTLWQLHQMKRYHYQHHFVRHDLGFGISSPLWDYIFGTMIYLRKLQYLLRWKY